MGASAKDFGHSTNNEFHQVEMNILCIWFFPIHLKRQTG